MKEFEDYLREFAPVHGLGDSVDTLLERYAVSLLENVADAAGDAVFELPERDEGEPWWSAVSERTATSALTLAYRKFRSYVEFYGVNSSEISGARQVLEGEGVSIAGFPSTGAMDGPAGEAVFGSALLNMIAAIGVAMRCDLMAD